MRHSILLQRTGDFWIDMGLIGLTDTLMGRRKGNFVRIDDGFKAELLTHIKGTDEVGIILTLRSTNLTLEYEEDEILNEVLSNAIASTRPNYIGRTKTGNEWWQRLGLFFFNSLSNPEDFFKLPGEQKKGWKIGVCNFCGTEERKVKRVGTIEYPLVVVPNRFRSFYSNLSGSTMICKFCALTSKFSPLRLFYDISSDKKKITAIALESNNLVELSEVFNSFSTIFRQSDEYRNFPHIIKYTEYPLENFLDFLFATIQGLEERHDWTGKNLLRSDFINKVHIIQGISGRRALSINRYYVIPNIPKVFELISSCNWVSIKQERYNSLIETARSIISKKGKKDDIETVTREEFARRLFYNKDISDILEEFLIKHAENEPSLTPFKIYNIDRFIDIYVLNQMGMDSHQLDVAKKIGDLLGRLAAEKMVTNRYYMACGVWEICATSLLF